MRHNKPMFGPYMKPVLAAGFCLSLAAPVCSQLPSPATTDATGDNPTATVAPNNMALGQMMPALSSPATLRMKGLTNAWRRVVITESANRSNPYGMNFGGPMFQDILADLGIGVYFTKWHSIEIGGETYLIAYRIDHNLTQGEVQAAIQQIYGGHHGVEDALPDGPRRFAPETPLRLSLLNLRTVGSLVDIQPFDAKRTLMQPADIIAASDDNLRRIGGYMSRLTQFDRYGMRGLPLRNVREARNAFHNFFHAPEALFAHPVTREAYQPNTALAGKRVQNISTRAELVVFYEARPGSDGKRGVVFLDGHIDRVPEWQWAQVKARQPKGLTTPEINALSARNLGRLGRRLRNYARSSNGVLPVMTSAYTTRRSMMQRLGWENGEAWSHPVTKQNYRVNTALSKRSLKEITNQAQVVAFYESTPAKDGTIGAVFLDGRVARIPQARWARVKAVAIQSKPTTQKRRA
jgi:hypothetical protein